MEWENSSMHEYRIASIRRGAIFLQNHDPLFHGKFSRINFRNSFDQVQNRSIVNRNGLAYMSLGKESSRMGIITVIRFIDNNCPCNYTHMKTSRGLMFHGFHLSTKKKKYIYIYIYI